MPDGAIGLRRLTKRAAGEIRAVVGELARRDATEQPIVKLATQRPAVA
jgi:hypothetical protein